MLFLFPILPLSSLISKMPLLWPFQTALNKMLRGKWIAFIMRPKFPWIAHQILHDLTSVCLFGCFTVVPMTPNASDTSNIHCPLHFCKCNSFHFQIPFSYPFLLSNFYFFMTRWYTFVLNVILPNRFWIGWYIKKTAGNSIHKRSNLRRV